jgi:hypothetical protein
LSDGTKPRAVLVDIDGTLAIRGDRSPYDWSRVGIDTPNGPIIELVQTIAAAGRHRMVLISGREDVCRADTEQWLREHGVPYDELYMRRARDNRKDSVVKAEMYAQHVADRYEVAFVVDDRDRVVAMWRRELGLTCLQVAEGDF